MSVGFESYYAEGKVQISSESRAFSLIKSGQLGDQDFRSVDIPGTQRISVATVSVPDGFAYDSPLLFIRNKTDNGRVCCLPFSTGVSILKWWNLSAGTGDIQYYLFARVAKAPGNLGIQIFDGNGTAQSNLLFDSTWNILNIKKVVNIPKDKPPLLIGSDVNGTYTTSNAGLTSNHAYCIPSPRSVMIQTLTTEVRLFECAWVNGTEIKINWIPQDGGDTADMRRTAYTNIDSEGMILICDVANFPLNYSYKP
ncbi:hypothetical protein [Acinetobacter pittii]|uniref:hypothetical protein n=1 Tax=Acinetobacter pittii TaxID=48296 RepID=UPI0022F0F856|nr:hypothetical protein [Acinetobacter baumannii]